MENPRALPTVSFQICTQLASTFLQLLAQVGNTAEELALARSALSSADGLTSVILNFERDLAACAVYYQDDFSRDDWYG